MNHFRCFNSLSLQFQSPLVIIEGENGAGKTSLLEALYYACYLRSFRTRAGKELIRFNDAHFFIKVVLDTDEGEEEQIEIGFEHNEKRVRRNTKLISSYKELVTHYRIVSLCGDDLFLIQGPPEGRRSFVDQSLFLDYPDLAATLRNYKSILHQRNMFLLHSNVHDLAFRDQLRIWSQQLWSTAHEIQEQRIIYIQSLETIINELIDSYFSSYNIRFSVSFNYQAKGKSYTPSFEQFWKRYESSLLADELRWKRTLFGVHLDDITISLREKQAKLYASRGQQKLVAFLLKCAHVIALKNHGKSSCILLDDFLTDFDPTVIGQCLKLVTSLNVQCFITSPINSFFLPYNLPFSPQTVIL